jgi:HK97 family phage major capsid protein
MTAQFTPEQLKHLEAVVAARVEKAMADRPAGAAVSPVIPGKSLSDGDRSTLFKRAFGYAIKAQLLSQLVGRTTEVTEDRAKAMAALSTNYVGAFREAQKSILTPALLGQGGSLQPQFYSDEVIEVLRDFAVVLQAGARTQDVKGKFNIGKLNSLAVAAFVNEGEEPTIPTPDTAMVTLDPKKLMGVVRATRHMVLDPSWNGAETLTQDMMSALGSAADKNALVGNGTGPNPSGIYRQVKAGQKNAAAAAFKQANLTSIIADLDKAELLVRESKIPFQGNKPGWVFTSKTLMALKSLRESGIWTFRQQLDNGTLNGYPIHVTDSISGQGASGGDPIFFGLFSQLYWGNEGGLDVSMSDQQEFTKDNTFVKGVGYVDFKLRHDSAFAVIDGVTYV